jgi:hypothetical protein
MSTERRSYPRFLVHFPLSISLPNDPDARVYSAEAKNLSRTSLAFKCHADLVMALLKQEKLPLTCSLMFKLPHHAHVYRLEAQILTHRRLSQFQYSLVVLFRHNDPAQEELLGNEVARAQPPGLEKSGIGSTRLSQCESNVHIMCKKGVDSPFADLYLDQKEALEGICREIQHFICSANVACHNTHRAGRGNESVNCCRIGGNQENRSDTARWQQYQDGCRL